MTAYEVLMIELETHGRTTYRKLVERYGDQGYSYGSFVAAAKRARDEGYASGPQGHGGAIVRAGVCPCCGRSYEG